MYKVNIDGIFHYAEYLNYVKKKESTGCYIQSTEDEAEAVVVDDILCDLPNKKVIGDKPVAYIKKIDSGEIIKKLLEENKKINEKLNEIDSILTELYQKD